MADTKRGGVPPLDDATMLKLADLLLNRVPGRTGILPVSGGTRVQSFRGKKMIETMLDKATPRKHGLQHVTNEDQALELAHRLLNFKAPSTGTHLFLPCERLKDKVGGHHVLKPLEGQVHAGGRVFDRSENGRYVWLYQGSQAWNHVKLAVLIVLVFGICLFPLWPSSMRTVVWYLSITLLLALIGVTVAQFVIFGVVWLFGYELWIVPNLWSDTISIMDAFKPLYTFDKSEGGNKWYRLVGFLLLAGLAGWVASQPSEFEAFVASNKKIIDDMYAGTLLSDGSGSSAPARAGGGFGGWGAQYGAGAYGGRRTTVPDLESLQKALQDEEEEAARDKAAAEEARAGSDAAAAAEAAADAAAEAHAAEGGDSGSGSDAATSAGGKTVDDVEAEAAAAAAAAAVPDIDAMLDDSGSGSGEVAAEAAVGADGAATVDGA